MTSGQHRYVSVIARRILQQEGIAYKRMSKYIVGGVTIQKQNDYNAYLLGLLASKVPGFLTQIVANELAVEKATLA